MTKVIIEGWQTTVEGAATPTGPITLRKRSKYAATPEEKSEFVKKQPGETIICLTVPPPKKPAS